jgi:hypothetical protein
MGTTWRADLADGSAVAIKRLATRGRNTSARLERLQRAAQLRNPNLLELLAIFREEGRFWVASRLDDGVPLSRLLRRGRLRAAFTVAVGMGVLSALTSLHQVGLSHGAIHAQNIHVGRDGTVRLGDYGLSSPPSGQSPAARRAADVRAVGTLLCSLLGVPADLNLGRASRRSRVAESPLGVAVRAIAAYRRKLPPGHEAIHASLTLWEAAGGMATARRQAQTREQLARMVATALGTDVEVTLRLVDATQPAPATPPAVPVPQPVTPAAPEPGREGARAPTFLTGLVALLVTLLTVGFMDALLAPSTRTPSTASAAPLHTPSAAARPAGPAQPAPPRPARAAAPQAPVLPPTSAGDVMALTLRYETPSCGPGSVCHVRVDLAIQPSRAVRPLTWTVYSIDACTGQLTPLGIAGTTVLRGWTRVAGDSFPRVPDGHVSRLVAITDGPARASSPPVALTSPSGCGG